MQLREFYTVLCTDDVAGTAAFWEKHFGFRRAFEADWYVHLTSTDSDKANLAILDYRHETIPAPFRRKASGVLVNVEVDDVDAGFDFINGGHGLDTQVGRHTGLSEL